MRKRITLFVALGLLVLAASAGVGLLAAQDSAAPATPPTPPVPPIPDTEIGLAKGSVFEVLVPPPAVPNTTDPGDLPPVGRAFPSAPPLVPHTVADFMPITREENWCVDCHMLDWTTPDEGDPTRISFSHYVDLRGDTDEIGSEVVGARWVCVSCHLPANDVPALVINTFGDESRATRP